MERKSDGQLVVRQRHSIKRKKREMKETQRKRVRERKRERKRGKSRETERKYWVYRKGIMCCK